MPALQGRSVRATLQRTLGVEEPMFPEHSDYPMGASQNVAARQNELANEHWCRCISIIDIRNIQTYREFLSLF